MRWGRAAALALGLLLAPAAAQAVDRHLLELTGDLQPSITVKIFPRVAGIVTKVNFHEGTVFNEGDVMAEIDPAEYELSLADARASRAEAKAKLAAMEAGGRPEERARAAADVASAESVYKNARLNLERLSALAAKGGASTQAVDDSGREADVDMQKLTSARKQLQLVREGPRPEEKDAARAELERAEASLRMAELKLSYTKILAPFRGVVGQRMVDGGAYVTAASGQNANPIAVFSQSLVLKAIVDIPEREMPYVRLGQPATISVAAAPGQTISGTVINLYPYVDPKTRMGKLEIEIPNDPVRLLPGMFVKAQVLAAEKPARTALEVMAGRKPGTPTEEGARLSSGIPGASGVKGSSGVSGK